MEPYVIRQGDSLATLSRRDDFDIDKVWRDPTNEELREVRDDPMVLAPLDIVYLPEPSVPEMMSLQSGTDNLFEAASVPPLYARLCLVDDSGAPLASQTCIIAADTGSPQNAVTDEGGCLDLEVPYGVATVRISLPDSDVDLVAQVAHLDPVVEATGLQQRLAALGLLPNLPAISDYNIAETVAGEYRNAAIQVFQQQHGLEPTGVLDDATRGTIQDAHGA